MGKQSSFQRSLNALVPNEKLATTGFDKVVPESESLKELESMLHDLTNCIAANLFQLALLRQAPDLRANVVESLRDVEAETNRSAELTRGISSFIRKQAGKPQRLASADLMNDEKVSHPSLGVGGLVADKIRGGDETILLVEDEIVQRRTMALCLRALGYAVLEGSNALDALEVWERNQEDVDLLLTDLAMPGELDGFDLVEKMRAKMPSLKVIISSGSHSELDEFPIGLDAEVFFIQKPCGGTALAQIVRKCLDSGNLAVETSGVRT